jgi:hypothetical protein
VDLAHSPLTRWFTSGECVQYLHQETCPRAAAWNPTRRAGPLGLTSCEPFGIALKAGRQDYASGGLSFVISERSWGQRFTGHSPQAGDLLACASQSKKTPLFMLYCN